MGMNLSPYSYDDPLTLGFDVDKAFLDLVLQRLAYMLRVDFGPLSLAT